MGRRSKKSEPTVVDMHRADEPMVGGIAQVVFDKLVGNISEAGQKKDDAGMTYASCWKSMKDRGVNTDPLKVVLRLRKQDERKSAAWIRSFMEFVAYFGLLDQQELPLEQPAKPTAGAVAASEDAEDVDQPQVTDDIDEGDEQPIVDVAECEKSDWGDDGPPAIVDVPEDAGAIFNAGARRAKDGGAAGDNPHEAGTEGFRLWASGFESVGDDGLEIPEFLRRTADQAAPADQPAAG